MNVIPYVKPVTKAETISKDSKNKALIIKAAAKTGKAQDLNIAEVLSKIPPTTLAKLNDTDITAITNAFIAVIDKQEAAVATAKATQFQTLKDYAFQLSQEIIEKIENGTYSDEDKAWKIYEYKLKAYALENGFTEEEADQFIDNKSSKLDILTEAIADGDDLGAEVKKLVGVDVDLTGEGGTSVTLDLTSDVTKEFNAIKTSANVDKKTAVITNAVLDAVKAMETMLSDLGYEIVSTEGTTPTTDKVFKDIKLRTEIENFISKVNANDFASTDEAEKFMELAGFKIKKLLSNKLGETLFLAAKAYIAASGSTSTEAQLTGAFLQNMGGDQDDPNYSDKLFGYTFNNLFEADPIPTEILTLFTAEEVNSVQSIFNVIDNLDSSLLPDDDHFEMLMTYSDLYMDFAPDTVEVDVKLANVKNLNSVFKKVMKKWFADNMADGKTLAWMNVYSEQMTKIMFAVIFLDMEKPMPFMQPEGESTSLWGKFTQVSSQDRQNYTVPAGYDYKIVEPLSGTIVAWAKVWDNSKNDTIIAMLDKAVLDGNPPTSVYGWIDDNNDGIPEFYGSANDGQVPQGATAGEYSDFKTYYDGITDVNALPFSITISYWSDDGTANFNMLEPDKFITNNLNEVRDFDGFMTPPAAAYDTNGNIVDFNAFDEKIPTFDITYSDDESNSSDFDQFFGEPVDGIIAKVVFDETRRQFLAAKPTYTTYAISPKDSSEEKPNDYWVMDAQFAMTWDNTNNTDTPWNPADHKGEAVRIFGSLVEGDTNASGGKDYRLEVHWVDPLPTAGTSIQDFVCTGILVKPDALTNVYYLNDFNGSNLHMAKVDLTGTVATEVITWFDNNLNKVITVGNPGDPNMDSINAIADPTEFLPLIDDTATNISDLLQDNITPTWAKVEENFHFMEPFDYRAIQVERLDTSAGIGKLVNDDFGVSYQITQFAENTNNDNDFANLAPVNTGEMYILQPMTDDTRIYDVLSSADFAQMNKIFAGKSLVDEDYEGQGIKLYMVELYGAEFDSTFRVSMDSGSTWPVYTPKSPDDIIPFLNRLIPWYSNYSNPEMNIVFGQTQPGTAKVTSDSWLMIDNGTPDTPQFHHNEFRFDFYDNKLWLQEWRKYTRLTQDSPGTNKDGYNINLELLDLMKINTYPDFDTPEIAVSKVANMGGYNDTFKTIVWLQKDPTTQEIGEITIKIMRTSNDPSDNGDTLEFVLTKEQGLFMMTFVENQETTPTIDGTVQYLEVPAGESYFGADQFPQLFRPLYDYNTGSFEVETFAHYEETSDLVNYAEATTYGGFLRDVPMGDGSLIIPFLPDNTDQDTEMDRLNFYWDGNRLKLSGIDYGEDTSRLPDASSTWDTLADYWFEPVDLVFFDPGNLPMIDGEQFVYDSNYKDGSDYTSSIKRVDGTHYITILDVNEHREYYDNTGTLQTENSEEQYRIYWLFDATNGNYTITKIEFDFTDYAADATTVEEKGGFRITN